MACVTDAPAGDGSRAVRTACHAARELAQLVDAIRQVDLNGRQLLGIDPRVVRRVRPRHKKWRLEEGAGEPPQ